MTITQSVLSITCLTEDLQTIKAYITKKDIRNYYGNRISVGMGISNMVTDFARNVAAPILMTASLVDSTESVEADAGWVD